MDISWARLGGSPLVTFFRGSVCYTYCDDGTLSQWNAAGTIPSRIKPPVNLADVDRVIFHDNDVAAGNYLLGFNAVGTGNDSHADFKRGSLTLTTSIRCLLQYSQGSPEPNLGAAVSLQAEFDAERLKHLWFSHSRFIDVTGQSSTDLIRPAAGAARPKSLKQAISDIADGKAAPVYLGRRNGAFSTDYFEVNTRWSPVLRGLMSDNPGMTSIKLGGSWAKVLGTPVLLGDADFQRVSGQQSLNVAFRHSDLNPAQFIIQFEAHFENARADGIKCFAIAKSGADESEAHFELAQGGAWYLAQRSSIASCMTASRGELKAVVPFEWMLELQCLSYDSTADRFNRWTGSGQRGIRGFAGASGASFLPSLVKGGKFLFTSVYQIADRVMVRNIINGDLWLPEKPPAEGKVSVRPLSVQYMRQPGADSTAQAYLDLPLCETTGLDPLQITAQLTSLVFSDRDTWSGFVLSSTDAWACPGQKAVRMGSLELGFGQRTPPTVTPARPSYFRLYDQGAGPQLTVNASLVVTRLLPGGQDDLPEDSFFAANTVTAAMPACRTASILPTPRIRISRWSGPSTVRGHS